MNYEFVFYRVGKAFNKEIREGEREVFKRSYIVSNHP
jgi:hypothetical protein